jgi:hypothetical protein
MDPTWILEVSGQANAALIHLFYGPVVDVTVVRLDDDELFVDAAEDYSNSDLTRMLDDVEEASHGGPIPARLRAVPASDATH